MRTIARLRGADVWGMVCERYHEISRSEDRESACANAPNRVLNDVIDRFEGATPEDQNHLTAMVCQVLITCLTLSGELALQNAAGGVAHHAKEFGNMSDFMNDFWCCIDKVGPARFSESVKELEAMPADAPEGDTLCDDEQMNEKEKNMEDIENKKGAVVNITNNYAPGAISIENNGQMTVGGGDIYVTGNKASNPDEKDLARLIASYLEPANIYLKEEWRDRMYNFWKVVVKALPDIFRPKNEGDEEFNKMYVFHVVGYLRSRDYYPLCTASRQIVEAVGESETKYRNYIDKKLDSIGEYSIKKKLEETIDAFLSKQ